MSLIAMKAETSGVDEMVEDLVEEQLKVGEKQVTEAASVLAKEMRRLLSKRRGPSAPGEPPRREEDWLWRGIGYERAKRRGAEISSRVGLGFGLGYKELNRAKAQGVNPFDYAWTMEYGGISGKTRTTRIEPRPWARPAEAKVESEVVRILTIH